MHIFPLFLKFIFAFGFRLDVCNCNWFLFKMFTVLTFFLLSVPLFSY